MFAQRLNELRVTLLLAPAGPLLVKEGRHHPNGDKKQRSFNSGVVRNPAQPALRDGRGYGQYDSDDDCFDMAFVWTQTADGPRFYLPGSSLRGVLRSAAEHAVARWNPAWARAGDPFGCASSDWTTDQRRREQHPTSAAIYAMAGPLERCFGHTALRGRWTIADAWMQQEQATRPVVRDGVGIDRRTGAAAEAIKFQFEALTGGVFATTLTLVNYELWQLGLLAHVLALLDGGHVRLGYGTRRGLGRVRLAATELRWRWYLPPEETNGLVIPSLARLAERAGMPQTHRYDWREDAGTTVQLPADQVQPDDATLGSGWIVRPARAQPTPETPGFAPSDWTQPLWSTLAATLPDVLTNWPLPAALSPTEPRL